MTPSDLKENMKKDNVLVLDVRERDEFAQSADKIEGSQNVPMGQVFVEAAKDRLPKDKKIVTVCASGTRCEIVAHELAKKGYDIESLDGGIKAWKEAA